ncbi:MAG: PASTA domain-containing protein, partial [Actinomycetota bacterium]|nr:PASTA domain-containing protein [Actinomycetota bacterium]
PVPVGPGGVGGPPAELATTRRRSGAYVVVLVVMLAILGVLLFLLGKQLGVFGTSAGQVTIPTDIVGRPVADVMIELDGLGLKSKPSLPAGTVSDSSPKPGATVSKGSTVALAVTPAPAQVKVPDVRNQDQQSAENILRGAGLVPGTPVTQNSDTVPANAVIDENPAAGTSVAKGSTVTLTVSVGKAQVKIPDEAGKDPTVAGAELGALNLKVSSANEASNAEPTGKVTRTSPAAGTSVASGSSVTIYVSSGAQMVTVPSVVGQPASSARAVLQAAGFSVSVSPSGASGLVVSQSPSGGNTASKGSTVTIVVASSTTTGATTSTSHP